MNENGEYGYIVTDGEGADTFVPFKKEPTKKQSISKTVSVSEGNSYTWTYTFTDLTKVVGITYVSTNNPGSISLGTAEIIGNVVKLHVYACNSASNKIYQVNVIGY